MGVECRNTFVAASARDLQPELWSGDWEVGDFEPGLLAVPLCIVERQAICDAVVGRAQQS